MITVTREGKRPKPTEDSVEEEYEDDYSDIPDFEDEGQQPEQPHAAKKEVDESYEEEFADEVEEQPKVVAPKKEVKQVVQPPKEVNKATFQVKKEESEYGSDGFEDEYDEEFD